MSTNSADLETEDGFIESCAAVIERVTLKDNSHEHVVSVLKALWSVAYSNGWDDGWNDGYDSAPPGAERIQAAPEDPETQ